MKIKAFITHKIKENYADCQDRFSVNPETKAIAVSDGMGSTWQQKIWAQLLVDTFTKSNNWLPTHETIKPLCTIWRQSVESFIQHLRDTNAPENIIYRNERNLAEGKSAGATFVGIRFAENKWRGSILGDSCLIEWNGSEARFHTSQDVEEFDSFPDYFDSNVMKQGRGIPKNIFGILEKDNYLFLVSDPFSDFLLEHYKQGDISDYMQKLIKLSSHEEFDALVADWRAKGMHNDDTTLVIIEDDQSYQFSKQTWDDINSMIEKEKRDNENTFERVDLSQQLILEQQKNEIEKLDPKDTTCFSPVEEDYFIVDFQKEYKKALFKKHPHTGEYSFAWTRRAVIDAASKIFNRYSIFIK